MTTPARRISKVIPGNPHDVTTKYVYDGDQVIVEYDDHDTQDTFVLVRKYIYGLGIDEPICMIVKGSPDQWYFYHYDGLGSVVALSNTSGTIVETYSYDAFGETTVTLDGSTGNPYRFTGRRFDSETGLYYYRARYYAPKLGRFLQSDPIGYDDGMNMYAYVGNNPVNGIDPYGLLSYLISRPVAGDSKTFTHNFIVANADYIGDPKATVYSYGLNAQGNVGRVDKNSEGFSENTYSNDIRAWRFMRGGSENNINIVRIPSPDRVVELYAKALVEDQDYSAMSGPFGANSNSAAQAIANAAANRKLPTPGGKKLSPGAGSWDEINFDIERVLEEMRRNTLLQEGCKK